MNNNKSNNKNSHQSKKIFKIILKKYIKFIRILRESPKYCNVTI